MRTRCSRVAANCSTERRCGIVVLVDGVADGTIEVTRRGDGDDRHVDLLLMGSAWPTVEGAPVLHRFCRALGRRVRRDERERIEVPLDRRRHHALLMAVRGAELVEPHSAVAEADLGVDRAFARPAEGLRHRVVDVLRRFASRRARRANGQRPLAWRGPRLIPPRDERRRPLHVRGTPMATLDRKAGRRRGGQNRADRRRVGPSPPWM